MNIKTLELYFKWCQVTKSNPSITQLIEYNKYVKTWGIK